jgi:tellurite resistance protein
MKSKVGDPLRCPLCWQAPVQDAALVYEWGRAGMGRVYLGCQSCLRAKLWRSVYRGSGEGGSSHWRARWRQRIWALVRNPLWAVWASLQNFLLAVALPRIGPTRWLRNALAEAGIAYTEFQQAQTSPADGQLARADRLRLGQALVVLMQAVAQADAEVHPQEWQALRTNVRALYAAEPELVGKLDPGKRVLPAPTGAQIQAAIRTLAGLIRQVDQQLVLRLLLGVAERVGGIGSAEQVVLRAICKGCGFGPELLQELEDRCKRPEVSQDCSSPWAILGLPEGADAKQVRRRYLKLAMKHHPDRHAHLGKALAAAANRRMKQINLAYDQLQQSGSA